MASKRASLANPRLRFSVLYLALSQPTCRSGLGSLLPCNPKGCTEGIQSLESRCRIYRGGHGSSPPIAAPAIFIIPFVFDTSSLLGYLKDVRQAFAKTTTFPARPADSTISNAIGRRLTLARPLFGFLLDASLLAAQVAAPPRIESPHHPIIPSSHHPIDKQPLNPIFPPQCPSGVSFRHLPR
ncbi:hypothetical protein FZEAL_4046 [Fusarium zealandicum]|uniref:Uncharacterized protein n=1 Tax=Fusarium zealandicum TaxID=1053134 RepID=A0A8H4XL82_9HYPO|nr:hypothetical protein FZEAL_4046 [Fusarium zealandicum]